MPEFYSPYWLLNIALFGLGFYVLIKGSDVFIEAAASVARIWRVPELIIGLTLVSIGTSLPEWASSFYAACNNNHGFVIGNVVGSCTTNIALMLGVAVVVGGGLSFPQKLLNRDAFFMNVVFFLTLIGFGAAACCKDGDFPLWLGNEVFGICFLVLAIIYSYYLFKHPDELQEEIPEKHADPRSIASLCRALGLLALGFVMIVGGSKLLVDNVVWMAKALGVSELFISATIVAFGTSLPEFAVTLGGVLKGRNDIAIGNIIGSCIFNILLIFGTCALITPLKLDPLEWVNASLMMLSGIVLMLTMWTHHKIVRWEGCILIAIYLVFLAWNIRVLF